MDEPMAGTRQLSALRELATRAAEHQGWEMAGGLNHAAGTEHFVQTWHDIVLAHFEYRS